MKVIGPTPGTRITVVIVRLALITALVGFFLPWWTSGPAIGFAFVLDPDLPTQTRVLGGFSALATLSGFLGSLIEPGDDDLNNSLAFVIALMCSLLALASLFLGLHEFWNSLQGGYFVTMLALAVAASASGGAVLRMLPGTVIKRSEDDVADWDRINDKDDTDQLQEYLLRHPNGRFAELAHLKLRRSGIESLSRPK